jgi:anti-anti-sigma factor
VFTESPNFATPLPGVAVVRLPDEVDLQSAAGVRDELLVALSRCPHLVVDATGVTFMDSTGINALVRAKDRAERLDGSVHVVATGRAVLRVLSVTQLLRVLAVVPTTDEALRCLSTPQTVHTCQGSAGSGEGPAGSGV